MTGPAAKLKRPQERAGLPSVGQEEAAHPRQEAAPGGGGINPLQDGQTPQSLGSFIIYHRKPPSPLPASPLPPSHAQDSDGSRGSPRATAGPSPSVPTGSFELEHPGPSAHKAGTLTLELWWALPLSLAMTNST